MGVIAEMIVNITARTEKFRKGMGDSRKQVDQFGKSAGKLGGVVQQLGGRLSAIVTPVGAVATGIGAMTAAMTASIAVTKQMAAEFDKLYKASQKLGISAQALQTFQFGGALAGISESQLETSFQRMVKNIGDAKQGIGEASRVFEQLGSDINRLGLLSAEDQFLAVADSISKLDTHAERMSATVAIFGRSGGELVRILELGSGGVAELRQELRDLGVLVNDQTLEQFAAMNDSATRLGQAFKGLKLGVATELSPAITQATTDLTALIKEMRAAADAGGGLGRSFGMTALDAGGPSIMGTMLKTYGFYRRRGIAAAGEGGGPSAVGSAAFPSVPRAQQMVTIGGDQMSRLINANAGVLSGRLQRGATGAANVLGQFGNLGNRISGGAQMAGMRNQWRQWRAIIGGFGGAGGDGGGLGFNQGIRSGSVEAQAARARARTDRSRVPEKQLSETQKLVSLTGRMVELLAEFGKPTIEEVTL